MKYQIRIHGGRLFFVNLLFTVTIVFSQQSPISNDITKKLSLVNRSSPNLPVPLQADLLENPEGS